MVVLLLAGRAEIGVPSCHHDPVNRPAAAGAGLSARPVGDDPGLRVGAEIGTTVHRGTEHVGQGGCKEREPDRIAPVQERERADPGLEQDFIGVDIPDSGDTMLVEEEQLNPPAGAGGYGEELRRDKGQAIRAESFAGDKCRPVRDPPEPPEPPGIGECQA